jgi:phosphodiesterase/alkaline phosphatase D-like protein
VLDRLTDTAEAPYANDTTKAGETHRVKIEHLKPGTTYFYMVDSGQGEGIGTEAMSSVAQFTTQR